MPVMTTNHCPLCEQQAQENARLRAELEQLLNQHAMTVENFDLYAEGRVEERAAHVADLAAAEAKLARVVEDMRWFADPENYRHPRPESTSPGPNVLVDGLQIASAALAEIGGGEGRG